MTALVDPSLTISYEGPELGTELMGAVQANFFLPGIDREVAVLVNIPALEWLANELGIEPTQEWQEAAAARIGEFIIREQHGRGRIEALTFLGRSVFSEHPGLFEAIKSALAA